MLCDQRSLGTLCAVLDIQTFEAEGGWRPRAASDLCLRVWASGHTLAWTRGQPAHPEGGTPPPGQSTWHPHSLSPLQGEAQSSCLACQHVSTGHAQQALA